MSKKPYLLIMAGGSGTRMWPLSTKKEPKQLLPLTGKLSLIEETLERCRQLTDKKRIFIGTGKGLQKAISRKVKYLKKKNFLIEPTARNTAPIIALFCAHIREQGDEKAPVIVLAADHHIHPVEGWLEAVKAAMAKADERIWCMGIKPSRPETGYGYIETGNNIEDNLFEIKSFKEKPDLALAQQYFTQNQFFWNSGMFIFSSRLFWQELKNSQPEIAKLATRCAKGKKALAKNFGKMPDISVDYAVMEKSDKLGVVCANFAWDDVGSFLALERILPSDEAKNIKAGRGKFNRIDSEGNTIYLDKLKHASLLGVKDLIIAEKDGVLLIASKDKIEKIKDLRGDAPEKLL